MLIDHAHQLIYTAIPKTASKTISCAFGHRQHPEPEIYHATVRDIIKMNPDVMNYNAWAVIRNPFSRLVSCYFDFTLKRICQYSTKIKYDKPLLSEFKDFEDFCLRLHESHWKDDIFFKPQMEFIKHPNPTKQTFLLRYEDLESDFKTFCTLNNIQPIPQLISQNIGVYNAGWRSYYVSNAQVEAIKTLYQVDLESFHYEF